MVAAAETAGKRHVRDEGKAWSRPSGLEAGPTVPSHRTAQHHRKDQAENLGGRDRNSEQGRHGTARAEQPKDGSTLPHSKHMVAPYASSKLLQKPVASVLLLKQLPRCKKAQAPLQPVWAMLVWPLLNVSLHHVHN